MGPLSLVERDALVALWLDPSSVRIRPGDTEDQVRRWVADTWGLWERETADLVGDCTLFYAEEHGAWEVAYGLRRDRWGRGYATEAVLGCLRYGFEQVALERIVADVDPDNYRSIHVLEKCGFARARGTDAHPVYAVRR
jgi:RimJ/RimL family protein N-acetyltransferase